MMHYPDYAYAQRNDTVGSATISRLVPNGGDYITAYGHLIRPRERITLYALGLRAINTYYETKVACEVGAVCRWLDGMLQADRSLHQAGDHALNPDHQSNNVEHTDTIYQPEAITG